MINIKIQIKDDDHMAAATMMAIKSKIAFSRAVACERCVYILS